MLSSVLRSKRAVRVNIEIMRAPCVACKLDFGGYLKYLIGRDDPHNSPRNNRFAMHYEPIIRRSFGLKERIKPLLAESYHSPLIERIKASGYRLSAGPIEFRLAREFGFCYGVGRAVDLAYETRERFPDKKIYLTSEIIHNPRVNQKLRELGIEFLDPNLQRGGAKPELRSPLPRSPQSVGESVRTNPPRLLADEAEGEGQGEGAKNMNREQPSLCPPPFPPNVVGRIRPSAEARERGKRGALAIPILHPQRGAQGSAPLDRVTEQDVVLIPAFGTPAPELELLKSKGCILVDTTCGSVVAVWRRVEQYARDGFTSVIHGKFNHEETRATSSRAAQFPDGKFLVVRDKKQAANVCDFILGKSSGKSFLDEFSETASPGFDPDRDLERVGCANQTTMLSSESLEIAERIRSAVRARWGEAELPKRFRHFDTICSATQDRQDAVLALARSGVGCLVIAGGYNSSNTGHLCEISSEVCPAYHVRDAEEIISKFEIRHKLSGCEELHVTRDWLPLEKSKLAIGITAGASTPDRIIEEVILKIAGVLGAHSHIG